ncbi:MAG: universal stress protein [Elusimicrobia bacterium]|nr:universal stress protein [Elusimicrobiota bacterium]
MKRFPPRRILVAADLSAPSLNALDAAKALALRWGAALEIVHVQHPPVITAWVGLDALPVSVPPASQVPRRKIEEKLLKAAGGFPTERLKLRTVHGWPPVALLDLAKPERADLMVMGTHGYAGLDRLLTGSVAEAVLRRARIPVFVVPERKSGPLVARVLAPWNGRPYATRALRWARELARSLRVALVVLHVDETGSGLRKERPELRRRLEKILGTGPDWRLLVRSGDARARIIAEANSGRYEFVVMSAHRRVFASDFVLGSTVERLLRHSCVPVLAVPSGGRRTRLTRRFVARAGARLY